MNTFNSSELNKDCFGLGREQKTGSCWLDSTLEIFLNCDTIGEIVRGEMFDYGLYEDKKVPFRVKPDVIQRNNIKSFLVYIIFNFILFNLEITSDEQFVVPDADSLRIRRLDSYNICEKSLEHFLSIVKDIFTDPDDGINPKALAPIRKVLKDTRYDFRQIREVIKIAEGYSGYKTDVFINLLSKTIPYMESYIDIYTHEHYEFARVPPIKKDDFLALSISIKPSSSGRHAVSLFKCNNKIFFYDNNNKINPATHKRCIELTDAETELLWSDFQEALKFIKTKFLTKYDSTNKNIEDFFIEVRLFIKFEDDYNKDIQLHELDNKKNIKYILAKEFETTSARIIETQFGREYHDILNEMQLNFIKYLSLNKVTQNKKTIVKKDALHKYLKYKNKYLSLKNITDIK